MKPKLIKVNGVWEVEAAFGTPKSWLYKAQIWAQRMNRQEHQK